MLHTSFALPFEQWRRTWIFRRLYARVCFMAAHLFAVYSFFVAGSSCSTACEALSHLANLAQLLVFTACMRSVRRSATGSTGCVLGSKLHSQHVHSRFRQPFLLLGTCSRITLTTAGSPRRILIASGLTALMVPAILRVLRLTAQMVTQVLRILVWAPAPRHHASTLDVHS